MTTLDIDLPDELDVETAVYSIEPDERIHPNAITGVAKRRFKEENGISSCRASKLFTHKGTAVVFVTEDAYRDWLDGRVMEIISEHEEAVADYHDGEKDALDYLVHQVIEECHRDVDAGEVCRRVERLLEMYND